MTRLALFLAAASLAVPAAAQDSPPPISLEQTMLLRCSAMFALVAADQQHQVPSALAYPAMAERGREFFVRSAARLMDERQLTREQIEAALRAEVTGLQQSTARSNDPAGFVDSIMRPCLSVLDASGL
ncbi:MAG: hypothetical protein ABIT16_11890 [Croceibacterium sp.]